MPSFPDRWVTLRVRFAGPFVVLGLRDDAGRRVRAQWDGPFELPGPERERLAAIVGSLARTLPDGRPGPHATGPVPLPLFVDAPLFLWDDPRRVDDFLGPLLASLDADRIQVVALPGNRSRRRAPFALPFRVVAHGPSAEEGLRRVAQSDWMDQPFVRERAFTITPPAGDADSLERALRAAPQDVLITDDLDEALATVRALVVDQRPRLIVSLDPAPPVALPSRLPLGTALAVLGPVPAGVGELLYGLVHDLPVHEAVKAATRTMSGIAARMVADPISNQGLRMRDALIALQSDTEALAFTLPRTTLKEFLVRTPLIELATFGDEEVVLIDRGMTDLITLRREASQLQALPVQFELFQQENQGLVPMAVTAERVAVATDRAEAQREAVGALLTDSIKAVVAEHQTRVVDIAVQRLETSPLLTSLDTRTTLEAGAVYRLRIHIGNQAPDSVVSGPQPPIDPLLPEPDAAGHLLDVVVQGKEFAVVGERLRTLHLPRLGGSKPVYFGVRAPDEHGPASLRVHVYYRNHLVHSYLLEALIARTEAATGEETLRATLAYARLERLTALDDVAPRALSFTMNQSAGGTHNVSVTGTGAAGELTLPEVTYQSEVDAFHKALTDAAVRSNGKARTYPAVAPGAPASVEAAAVLRDLIQRGSALYRSMKKKAINSSPAVAQAIDAVKLSDGKSIQVVRLDSNYVFPWRVIYDYDLPPALPDAPVCLGSRVGANGQAEPCGHTHDAKAYCVRGFWSVRHFLEEMITRQHELKGPVTRPARDGVRLVCDTSLAGVATLQQDVNTAIGTTHVVSGPTKESPLLDLLWTAPPERPAILIVLGHMDLQRQPGILDSDGILLEAGEWLTMQHFDQRLSSVTWQQPRPVVLLMACNAATMTATTINEFVSSFHTAGAGAIIGAEAMVGSDLAAAFASDVTRALWAGDSLGKAMADYRRRTLEVGNPLAFLFGAIGDVDLTIQ